MNASTDLILVPGVREGTLALKGGRSVAFERVVLELHNGGKAPATCLRLRLSVRQGSDTICELDEPLEGQLTPGAERSWDLYEVLLEKGRGFPSKVRLFGIKAALEWDFIVVASVAQAQATFRFRWSGPPEGPIMAAWEALP